MAMTSMPVEFRQTNAAIAPAASQEPCGLFVQPTSPGPNSATGPLSRDPYQSVIDDTWLWPKEQFREHALFMALGLEDQDLRTRAASLHSSFEALKRDRMQRISATVEEGMGVVRDAVRLTQELTDLQNEALRRLDSGKWIGWLFPSFLRHTRDEQLYYLKSVASALRGGITHTSPAAAREDVCTLLRVIFEHAVFETHLVDELNPLHRQLVDQARKYADQLGQLSHDCRPTSPQMLQLSTHLAKELHRFQAVAGAGIRSGLVKSVIHPLLADHVQRETNQAIRIFEQQFANTAGAAQAQRGR